MDITGCGAIGNHTISEYQCGDQAGCPQCPLGYQCEDHSCTYINRTNGTTNVSGVSTPVEKPPTQKTDVLPCLLALLLLIILIALVISYWGRKREKTKPDKRKT